MQTPLRILFYLSVVYGFLFSGVFAFGKSKIATEFSEGETRFAETLTIPAIEENAAVPEPGSIGLVAFLVVLLALQRQRGGAGR